MNLSIIIPVFNSSKILKKLVKSIKHHLNIKLNNKFEIIFINDHSTDDSWSAINELSKKYSFVKGIDLKKNVGQHTAIFVGLNYATGSKIITMDDDLQHPPSYLLKIYYSLLDFDVCYTSYINRQHVLWKILVSKLNNIFSNFLFNKPNNVYLSSFRGFQSKIKNKIINEKPNIIFLDSLILKHSKKITSIKIVHQKRFRGESNYNLKKLLNLWFDMIENFYFFPIRIGSFIGVSVFLLVKFIRFFQKKKYLKIEISKITF